MVEYCDSRGVPHARVGKLIVAVSAAELPRLHELHARGVANGVPGIEILSAGGLRALEPYCSGVGAVRCPGTGIVDFASVGRAFAADVVGDGGSVRCGAAVVGMAGAGGGDFRGGVAVRLSDGSVVEASRVITCAGAYADRLAVMAGGSRYPIILPVRGEYLLLRPGKRRLVRGNIYPVPDARLPFLGVHFTPRMNGEMWLGPNAVPALSREGYSWMDVRVADVLDVLRSRGAWALGARFAAVGAGEVYRSLVVSAQVRALQRFVPEITVDDVMPGPAGCVWSARLGRGEQYARLPGADV